MNPAHSRMSKWRGLRGVIRPLAGIDGLIRVVVVERSGGVREGVALLCQEVVLHVVAELVALDLLLASASWVGHLRRARVEEAPGEPGALQPVAHALAFPSKRVKVYIPLWIHVFDLKAIENHENNHGNTAEYYACAFCSQFAKTIPCVQKLEGQL